MWCWRPLPQGEPGGRELAKPFDLGAANFWSGAEKERPHAEGRCIVRAMTKSRNNLLGVGGQRKKASRADRLDPGAARTADRKAADDRKQELAAKMRERALGKRQADGEDKAS